MKWGDRAGPVAILWNTSSQTKRKPFEARSAVNQVDSAIARLRLFLVDIDQKEKQLQATRRQFRDQMERVISFALYRETGVEQTLSMMVEVNQRSQNAEQVLQHLGRLRARVVAELESLELTKGIEAAKLELAELESQKAEIESRLSAVDIPPGGVESFGLPSLEELTAEIRRLQSLIHEASERAVQQLVQRRA